MADDALPEPVVDLRAELALLKAIQAPMVFFERVGTHGARDGVGNITLEAGLHVTFEGRVLNEPRMVGHLRFPLAAIPSIREALDRIELLVQPAASSEKQ